MFIQLLHFPPHHLTFFVRFGSLFCHICAIVYSWHLGSSGYAGKIMALFSLLAGDQLCCGTELYHSRMGQYSCCGDAQIITGDSICCNRTPIDGHRYDCIGGTKVRKGHLLCGNNEFDPERAKCCEGKS